MASSPEADGPRHLGRIVDPLARDDGATEPAVELDPETTGAAEDGDVPAPAPEVVSEDAQLAEDFVRSATPPPVAALPGEPPTSTEETAPAGPVAEGGHPVRDKLLARAAASRRERTDKLGARAAAVRGSLDEIGNDQPPARRALDLELDLVGSGAARPPAAPLVQSGGAPLSPGMVALFGTLLGLATVASLIALMIDLHPAVHPQAGTVLVRAAPTATATTTSTAQTAPQPKPKHKKIPGPWRVADLKGDSDYRIISGEVGRDPFLKVIQDKGLDKSQAYSVLGALKNLVNLDKCGPHDKFVAAIKRSTKELTAFEYIASKEEVYQARAGKNGALVGKKLDLHVERAEVKGAFAYDGKSLAASAEAAGFGPGLKDALDDALHGHMDLDDLQVGDRFRVVAQEVTVLGEFDRYAGIEAVEYRPVKDKPQRFYYFSDSQGNAGYYDESGKAPYKGGWRFPIPGAHVTSPFNLHRMHPILHKIMPHLGTDIGAPIGTPVHASSYGVVERMSGSGATGNLVMLKHSGGMETGYAHLVRFAKGLKVGDHVKRFQVIGYVGSTGRSTGPHLHWIAKRDGKFIDAMTLKPDSMRVLPHDELDAFKQVKAKYDAMLDAIPLPAPLPQASAPAAPPPAEPAAAAPPLATAPPVAAAPAPPPQPASAPQAAAQPAAAQPAAAQPAAAQPAAPAKAPGSAVYLTDKELLKLQSATDDGEVSK